MKTSFIIISAVLFLALSCPISAEELSGNISIAAGTVLTDKDFADAFDLDNRFEVGVICDAQKARWPVSLTASYFFSYGRSKTQENTYGLLPDKNTDVVCSEMFLGMKKIFNTHLFIKPYLAGGVCTINAYADISYDHEYDATVGTWFGAGAYFPISRNWQLNLEWRRSRAKVNLFDKRLDAGGDHFDLSFGYHFPRQQVPQK